MTHRQRTIEARALEVRYGRTTVLNGIDLEVAPGEVCALLGRNGAGKSSLVRCLLGHQKPALGSVRLFGRDAWKDRVRLMERVGVVPETGDAPPTMSALQLSRFCARLYPRWDEAGLARRLERFEVPLTLPFGRLSKGQRGQVMLALALAHGPELLVLDDPTLGLDVVARKAVFEELVVELADRGITVFLTSHDLPGIEGIASRVIFLRHGRFLLDEDLETLKHRFRRLRLGPVADEGVLAPLAPRTVADRGRDIEAVVEGFDDETFAELRRTAGLERAAASPLSLEEILLTMTGECLETISPQGG